MINDRQINLTKDRWRFTNEWLDIYYESKLNNLNRISPKCFFKPSQIRPAINVIINGIDAMDKYVSN